jgi:hypothetical protein
VNGKKICGDGRTINGVRILQLVPAAPGWWVQYRFEARKDCWSAPLACWALVEDDDGFQYIRGVDPTNNDWHNWGEPIRQEVLYFYSTEVPENAIGTSEPPLPEQ